MKLLPGIQALAVKLQEEATELSNSDICRWLSAALSDMEGYCYYCDHFGDGTSGDVIYSCGGCIKRAPYEIRSVNGKSAAVIDDDSAVEVMPRTTYEEKPDDDDDMASMESPRGFVARKLYTEVPMWERFISKAERDAMDPKDFAGKGQSFPIRKPGDVQAAVRSMGRAGSDNHSTGTLKKNIISIAKRKGFSKQLPKSWQDGSDDDAKVAAAAVDVELAGDCVALREGAVGQDGMAYLKLIAPGWGSSGYYSPEILERDGPKVFPKGTKNFWNHQTDAEEAARPEGDLRDLASVLTEDAKYIKGGPAGDGLYAKAEVQPHFRSSVDSLAKHIGMSIRASGKAREGEAEGKKGRIIEQLTRGLSVDYVTTPGAGGKILQLFEAARSRGPQPQGDDEVSAMDEVRKLRERLALRDAADYAAKKLAGERLNEATKQRIIANVTKAAPISAEGELDQAKLDEVFKRELTEEVNYLASITGGPVVTGLGVAGGTVRESKDDRKKREKADDEFEEGMKEVGRTLGFSKAGRKLFVEGRGAA